MKNKISAVLVDKHCDERNLDEIKSNNHSNEETSFDITLVKDSADFCSSVNNFVDVDCIISIGDRADMGHLYELPFLFRKKWVHFDKYDPKTIVNAILATFACNVNRFGCRQVFSVFTCTCNTGLFKLQRLHNSLKAQTYSDWNWFILDDSKDNETIDILNSFKDPRITIVKNVSVHGNIGFNKHNIAMMCTGDYLVEVDHDDELIPCCFQTLKDAFDRYPSAGFAYSAALELKGKDKVPIVYCDGWGHGEGMTAKQIINGKEYVFSESPGITPFSIRTIYAQPNHVRCWRKETYHEINGHNPELSVLDDMEILIRTFLHTRMIKIPKVLYIQYEGEGERGVSKDNAQSCRFNEIQRTVWILKNRYDKDIHNRILELGFKDIPWDEKTQHSNLGMKHEPRQETMSYQFDA